VDQFLGGRSVREACRDFYVDWGRDAWDPVLMFNMVCLQFLYDLSDREVEEQATFNLVYKWFLGLSAEELPPDHTTLCRFRVRLGAEGFQKLCNQVVEQARELGCITDRRHIIDATHIAAKVDLFRLKKEHRQGDDDNHYVDRHSPDPDARFGRKSKNTSFYGYKAHEVQDADSELLVQVKTTPATRPTARSFRSWWTAGPGRPWQIRPTTARRTTPTWPPRGWLPASSAAGAVRGGPAFPAGNGPRSRENLRKARIVTV
jgi:transposase, IS5 family